MTKRSADDIAPNVADAGDAVACEVACTLGDRLRQLMEVAERTKAENTAKELSKFRSEAAECVQRHKDFIVARLLREAALGNGSMDLIFAASDNSNAHAVTNETQVPFKIFDPFFVNGQGTLLQSRECARVFTSELANEFKAIQFENFSWRVFTPNERYVVNLCWT